MRQVDIHCHDDRQSWIETYKEGERGSFHVGHPHPENWAYQLIERFNGSLRPNELFRTVDRVEVSEIIDPEFKPDHQWQKTNAVTISDRSGLYDTMRCSVCGVTAKRSGLDYIKIDSKYKKFEKCPGERIA